MESNVKMLSDGLLKSPFEEAYIGYVDDVVEFLEEEVKSILSSDLYGTFDEQKRMPINNILDVLCGIDNDVTLKNITMSTILFLYRLRGEYFYQIVETININMKEMNQDVK